MTIPYGSLAVTVFGSMTGGGIEDMGVCWGDVKGNAGSTAQTVPRRGRSCMRGPTVTERTPWLLPPPQPHRRDYSMREPCRWCDEPKRGYVVPSGGQNVVRCAGCDRAVYNAPKSETGEAVRSLATRPDIKVSKRARILDRDNGTCVGCHRDDVPLEVGHLLSVKDGRELGATDAELWHDDNLAAMCSACNSGFSAQSISLRLIYRVLVIRARKSGQ